MTCNFMCFFLEGYLDSIRLLQAFFDQIVWHAISIQQVYQLNWGVFCALMGCNIVTIFVCLDLYYAWILIVSLLARAGISTSANGLL